MIAKKRMVFISHPDKSVMYARTVQSVLQTNGFSTWLWEDDKPVVGDDRDTVLFQAIGDCDYFAHLCTAHTKGSDRQMTERRFAKVLRKPFVLLVFRPRFLMFKRNYVPRDVSPTAMYNRVSPQTFEDDCARIARRLIERLDATPSTVAEGSEIYKVNLSGSSTPTGSLEVEVVRPSR